MKIALVEAYIEWEAKKKNYNEATKILGELKKYDIDIAFFPEMSATGFSMNVNKTSEVSLYTIVKVKEWSHYFGMALGYGWVKKAGDKCENHYSIVAGNDIISDYIKIHPFSYSEEDKYFDKGKELALCRYKDFVIGTQICYDLRFPEPFQALSKEASLIIIPANWPKKRREHWNCLLRARAIENQVYVAGINCLGEIGDLQYSGDSQLISPNGEICDADNEVIIDNSRIYIYEVKNDVEKYREDFPVKKDRQEKLYKAFMK